MACVNHIGEKRNINLTYTLGEEFPRVTVKIGPITRNDIATLSFIASSFKFTVYHLLPDSIFHFSRVTTTKS